VPSRRRHRRPKLRAHDAFLACGTYSKPGAEPRVLGAHDSCFSHITCLALRSKLLCCSGSHHAVLTSPSFLMKFQSGASCFLQHFGGSTHAVDVAPDAEPSRPRAFPALFIPNLNAPPPRFPSLPTAVSLFRGGDRRKRCRAGRAFVR